MKKLKINKNLSKKIVSCVLVGTMGIFTLTGCSSKNSKKSLLEDTILENTNVVVFEDGNKDIVKMSGYCGETECEENHKVYASVVTNEYFISSECGSKYAKSSDGKLHQLNKYTIMSDAGIIRYLTKEEIVKAGKEELTEEDISNILDRIFSNDEVKVK